MAEKRSVVEELRARERDVAALKRQRALECDHTSKGGVVPISQYKGFIRDANKYPATTVIHPDCGAIFDSEAFTKEKVFNAVFTLESMCHQIKLLTGANMKDKNREDLEMQQEYIEYLNNSLVPYYNSMVDALSSSNKNQQRRSERKIGGMGISSNLFS